jgi:hypothetical protein
MSWLAQQQPPPNAPEFGGSSPIGLVVILCLFIATFLLVRSMNTHLKKVPESFQPPETDEPTGDADKDTDADLGTGPDTDAGNGPKTATPQ